MIKMKKEDIDNDNGMVVIRESKSRNGGSSREVPISSELLKELNHYIQT